MKSLETKVHIAIITHDSLARRRARLVLPDPVAGRETRCTGRVVSKPRAGSKAFVASSLRSRLVPTEAPPFPARTDLPRPRRPRPSSSASSSPCGRTRTRVILAGGQASLRIVCAGVRSSLRLVTDGPRPSRSCSPRGRSVVLAGGRRASLLLLLRCTTHEGCGGGGAAVQDIRMLRRCSSSSSSFLAHGAAEARDVMLRYEGCILGTFRMEHMWNYIFIGMKHSICNEIY